MNYNKSKFGNSIGSTKYLKFKWSFSIHLSLNSIFENELNCVYLCTKQSIVNFHMMKVNATSHFTTLPKKL